MKVTFPHMGNLYIIVKGFFESLNIDFIPPPPTSKKTLQIGTKYSPEQACLPFKIMLGNYVEAVEKGADTLLVTGGAGPCRMGFFSEIHRMMMKDLGYDIKLISFEVSDKNIKELGRVGKEIFKNNSLLQILKEIRNAIKVSIEADKMDHISYKVRPREINKGQTDKIMSKFRKEVNNVRGSKEMLKLINKTQKNILSVEIDKDTNPAKIGLVGEIYMLAEPFGNFDLARKLGNMGIEVHNSITISEFIIDHMLKPLLRFDHKLKYEKAAQKYLDSLVGGHGQNTIGNSVIYANKNYDGIIQVYPFTCMPEIVAQSLLPHISSDYNIPIMTLIIDEMTGEAGYNTRIEAFTDLLKRRKERLNYSYEYILSGN